MRCDRCGLEIREGRGCPSCGTSGADTPRSPEETLTLTALPRGAGSPAREGAPLAQGTVLGGRYRILSLIGRGGMGEIYRAFDLKLDQDVALKFLPEALERDERALSRLLGEVRNARQVSHPNVCRVYDVAEAEGRHFLTMEHVRGDDLASILQSRERLPAETALSIARQLCAGLAAAHDRGVLHRDLKPSNILIDERGVARIADFGLAEASAVPEGARAAEGTPSYMAPEQLAGKEVTQRSDLYALGLVLYELFTGRSAHGGGSRVDLLRLRESPPPPLSTLAPDIDPGVERAVRRCLESAPARRPSSARSVAAALPGRDSLGPALEAAQLRADRIAAFRAEMADLRAAGILRLEEADLAALEKHHEAILRDLVRTFDVDLSERGKVLSLGMRLLSLIGAVALSASVFYFFYRIWGVIPLPAQIAALAAAPATALLATALLAPRERSAYFTSMAAMIALAGVALDSTVLSASLSIPFSHWQLLGWGFFALVLAYGYGLRLLLFMALITLALFTGGSIATATGIPWVFCLDRGECLMPAGALLLLLPGLVGHRRFPGFVSLYRILGLLLLFFPIIVLANEGDLSFLPVPVSTVRLVYQLLGFAGGAAAIALGLARREKELAYGGSAAFVVLLFSKFFSWWWEWMPKYLFFLIMGLAAVAVLLILKRLRGAMTAMATGALP